MIPVTLVTVSEDRAVVVRRGPVRVEAGTTRLRVEDVAPVLVDKSLRASVERGPAKSGEVSVLRERVLSIPDDARTNTQALDAEIEAIGDAIEQLRAAIRRVKGELDLLDKAARANLSELSFDAAHGALPQSASQVVRAYEARERELRAEGVRLDFAVREKGALLERLRARRATLDHPATRERASIEVVIAATAAGEIDLAIEYVVPGACWRPQHTAILEGKKVTFSTDACVWQNTGEPWREIELRLSTERPSLGAEPPELEDDVLAVTRRQEIVHVETREQTVESAGFGGQVDTRVPGIDDGGEPRVLIARGKASVATDGRPHRVPIGGFESAATVESMCAPQLEEAVIVRSAQKNTSREPLLAGPVDLVRSGGFVGRTTVEFIAPGESFELGWGPDPGVRVSYDREQVEEEPGTFSGWLARHVREIVYLSVLDGQRRSLAVRMRIPVSEIDKVQITQDVKETTGEVKVDEDGFLLFPIEITKREEIELAWTLKRHKDVMGL